MARVESVQFNIRSRYARRRTRELARQTGMTAAEIVEDALRSYVPPGSGSTHGKLVRRGPLLVRLASGKKVSLKSANAALDAARERRE